MLNFITFFYYLKFYVSYKQHKVEILKYLILSFFIHVSMLKFHRHDV